MADTVKTSTLVPGLLVGLKTSLKGNVTYRKIDLETGVILPDDHKRDRWETVRDTADVAEHEAAIKVRSKARALITGCCAASSFGYLCPSAQVENLNGAVLQARKVVTDFNAASSVTKITLGVITGRIADNDVEAARAINGELSELIESMRRGCEQLNPTAIREAAAKARDIQVMLTPAMQERVSAAVALARQEARRLVKSGESAAIEVDRAVVQQLAFARAAFLDLTAEADPDSGAASAQAPESAAAELDIMSFDPVVGAYEIKETQGDYDIAEEDDSEEESD